MYEHFSKQTFLLLMDTNITNTDSVLLIQMPVSSSPVQTDFLTSAFALLGEIERNLAENGIWKYKVVGRTNLWWVHPKRRWVSWTSIRKHSISTMARFVIYMWTMLISQTCRHASVTDSRTGNWFLMSSPLPQALVIAAYIYFVTSLGPRIMENRKAFDLKGVLIFYNFGVVALSLYMCYEVSHLFPLMCKADICTFVLHQSFLFCWALLWRTVLWHRTLAVLWNALVHGIF